VDKNTNNEKKATKTKKTSPKKTTVTPALDEKKTTSKTTAKADTPIKAKSKTKASKAGKIPIAAYYGTGKRKTAIAKVWLYEGQGQIIINNHNLTDYLKSDILVKKVCKPLNTLGIQDKYNCTIKALGGGLVGQAEASQLGIARALLKMNLEFRPTLKENALLTRDPRIKERKKYGRKKARKGYQFRKR
jgi:small subunit ribosomal protein S9